MKLNKIKLLVLLFALFCINVTNVDALTLETYTNEETKFQVILEDDAELLSNLELENLKNEMIPLTKYGNVIFKTIEYNTTTTEKYARNYYYTNFKYESGTLFLIDMDNRYIYVFSDGDNYNVITEEKALIITDNSYTYASDEEYYECASKAFSQIHTLLIGGKIEEPMRYISNLFISITLSAFFSFFLVVVNTKTRKIKNKEILDKCNISFVATNIKARKVGVTKLYEPRKSFSSSSSGDYSDWDSSSSDGGGGGGFSGGSSGGGFSGGSDFGGGGSSGGGGGHRF